MGTGSEKTRRDGLAPRDALKSIREKAGLRQVDISDLTAIEQSQISAFETGKRIVRLETFASWASICGYRLALIPDDDLSRPVFIESRPRTRARRSKRKWQNK